MVDANEWIFSFRAKFDKWVGELFSSDVWPGLNYMRNTHPDQAYSTRIPSSGPPSPKADTKTGKKKVKKNPTRPEDNRYHDIHARSTPTIARSTRGSGDHLRPSMTTRDAKACCRIISCTLIRGSDGHRWKALANLPMVESPAGELSSAFSFVTSVRRTASFDRDL